VSGAAPREPETSRDGLESSDLSPRERAAVIHRIRMLMEFWAITPDELEQAEMPPPAATPAAAATIKYRHPHSGETWDGVGSHPQWLRDALLKEGFTVEQLRAAVGQDGA
jgi:DNA-binding protein H-NS